MQGSNKNVTGADTPEGLQPTIDSASRQLVIADCFFRAGELPPEEREPFVLRTLKDDLAGQKEVIGLLSDDSKTNPSEYFGPLWDQIVNNATNVAASTNRDFVLAVPTDAADDRSTDSVEQAYSTGETPSISGYRILEMIGQGGMGRIYRAIQESVARPVAIKVIRPSSLDEERSRKRFTREAKAVAALHHPNIIGLHEYGQTDDGTLWLSMDLVAGQSLSDEVAKSQPDAIQSIKLALQLASAMAFAHRKGVLHRDIKPDNILVDTDGQLKLIDFGLARPLDQSEDDGITREGHIAGTLRFMAPEQLRADNDAIGPAVDVWAIGCVLYKLLTGRLPFDQTSMGELSRAIEEIEPPSLASLHPRLDRDIEQVCLKCLRKMPEERYADAGALADDLRAITQGHPVAARPLSTRQRTARWARKNPLAVGFISVCLVGAIVSGYYARRASLGESLAQRRSEELGVEKSNVVAKAVELQASNKRMRRELYASGIREVADALQRGRFQFAFRQLTSLIPESGQEDHREMEWSILWERCLGAYRMRYAATDEVNDPHNRIDFAPKENRIAQSGKRDTRLWEIPSGQLLRQFNGYVHPRFTPDGKRLVMAKGRRVVLFDANTYKRLGEIDCDEVVDDLEINRAGDAVWVRRLLSRNDSPKHDFQLWSLDPAEDAKPIYSSPEIDGMPRVSSFSPDDNVVISIGHGLPMSIIDRTKSGVKELTFNFNTKDVSFSNDGRWVCRSALGYEANILDTKTWQEVHRITGNKKAWQCGKFSPDDKQLYLTGYNEQVWVYNTEDWTREAVYPAGMAVWTGTLSASGRYLAIGGETGTQSMAEGNSDGGKGIRILDTQRGFAAVTEAYEMGEIVEALSRSGGSDRFLAAKDGKHYVRLTPSRELAFVTIGESGKRVVPIDSATIADWCWLADGQKLAFIDSKSRLFVVDRQRGRPKQLYRIQKPRRLAHDPASPEHLLVLVDDQLSVVDQEGLVVRTIDLPFKASQLVADNNRIVLTGSDQIVCLDAEGKQQWSHPLPSTLISAIDVGPQGSVYLSSESGRLFRADSESVRACGRVSYRPERLFVTDSGRRLITSAEEEFSVVDPQTSRVMVTVNRMGDTGVGVDAEGRWVLASTKTAIGTNYVSQFVVSDQEQVLEDLHVMLDAAPQSAELGDALARQLRFMGASPKALQMAASTTLAMAVDRMSEQQGDGQQEPLEWSALPAVTQDQAKWTHLKRVAEAKTQQRTQRVVVQHPKTLNDHYQSELVSQSLDLDLEEKARGLQDARIRFSKIVAEMKPGEVASVPFPTTQRVTRIDEHRLLGGWRNQLYLLDLASGQQKLVMEVPDWIYGFDVDLESGCVYVGTGGFYDMSLEQIVSENPATIRRLDLETWKQRTVYSTGEGTISHLSLTADRRFLLASGAQTETVRIDLKSGEVKTLADAKGNVSFATNLSDKMTWGGLWKNIAEIRVDPFELTETFELPDGFRNRDSLHWLSSHGILALSYRPDHLGLFDVNANKLVKEIRCSIGWDSRSDASDESIYVGTEDGIIVELSGDINLSPRLFSGVASTKIFGLCYLPKDHAVYFSALDQCGILKLPPPGDSGVKPPSINVAEKLKKQKIGDVESLPFSHGQEIYRLGETDLLAVDGKQLRHIELDNGEETILTDFPQKIWVVGVADNPKIAYVAIGANWDAKLHRVTPGEPGSLIQVDLENKTFTTLLEHVEGRIQEIVPTPDQKYLLVGGDQTGTWLVDLKGGENRQINAFKERVSFSIDETSGTIFALEGLRLSRIELPSSGSVSPTPIVHHLSDLHIEDKSNEFAIQYFQELELLCVVQAPDQVDFVDPKSGRCVKHFDRFLNYDLRIHRLRDRMIAATKDGHVVEIQGAIEPAIRQWQVSDKPIQGVALTPHIGGIYFSGSDKAGVVKWFSGENRLGDAIDANVELAQTLKQKIVRDWENRTASEDAESAFALEQQIRELREFGKSIEHLRERKQAQDISVGDASLVGSEKQVDTNSIDLKAIMALPMSRKERWAALETSIPEGKLFKRDSSSLREIVMLPDFQAIAIGDSGILRFDLLSGKDELIVQKPDRFWSIALDEERQVVYFGTGGEYDHASRSFVNKAPIELMRYSVGDQSLETIATFDHGRIGSLAIINEGKTIVGAIKGGETFRLDTATGEKTDLSGIQGDSWLSQSSFENQLFAAAYGGAEVVLVDIMEDRVVKKFTLPITRCSEFTISSNGKFGIAVSEANSKVVVFETSDGKVLRELDVKIHIFGDAIELVGQQAFLVGTNEDVLLKIPFDREGRVERIDAKGLEGWSLAETPTGDSWFVGSYRIHAFLKPNDKN